MKKFLVLLPIFFLTFTVHATHQFLSRSYMFTKPAYYDVATQQALWHDIIYKRQHKVLGAFQLTPFFQQSTTLKKSARYFLIDGKTSLFVAGDDTTESDILSRDIRAEWIGLPSDFQGTLSMNPKQQQYGFCIEYNQDLKAWFDVPILRDMYLTIVAPVVSVHNDINLRQANIANPSPVAPQDILQAFDQKSWEWAKIGKGYRRTELAEIRIMLGSLYGSEDSCQIDYNSILIIPSGKKQKAEYLFSPVVGNNHHMGIGAGVEFQVPLNRDQSNYICSFILDLESVILIRNKQWRTFDLRGKEWSRFLLMNKEFGSQPLTNIPGVNLMTQRATIKPFNMVDFAMGWRWKKHTGAELEIGWGVWGHGYERVEHINDDHPFLEPFGIAGTLPGTTAHNSTIAQHFPIVNDSVFVPINIEDFDPQSASNPGTLNFRVFASGGGIWKRATHDFVFGAGWSIDIPYKNSTLQVWKFWFKLGANF